MADQHYSNDKIDSLLNDLKTMTVNQNITLARIEAQTTKTNGRVTKLEGWKNWGAGAIAIILVVVVPLVVFVFETSVHNLQTQIDQHVK